MIPQGVEVDPFSCSSDRDDGLAESLMKLFGHMRSGAMAGDHEVRLAIGEELLRCPQAFVVGIQ